MDALILVLFPLLLADIINPVLFAGTVYSLGTQKPIRNALALLLSFVLSYFLAGVVIALILDSFDLSQASEYYLELIVGALLLFFAWFLYKDDEEEREERLKTTPDMGILSAIYLGLQINLIGLPFALPYIAAIDQMLIAQASTFLTVSILAAYNLAYVFPFFAMVFIRWIWKDESNKIFERVNFWIHHISAKYLPIIFAFIGLYLVIEGLFYSFYP